MIVIFRYDWKKSFIGLLLGQLYYMALMLGYKEISCPEDECSRDAHASLDVTRRDKVRNEDIRTKIGVAPIKEKMRENRLRWFDHVRSRPTDAPVRRVEHIKLGTVKRAQERYGWR